MRSNEKPTLVLKIGGNQVEDEAFLAGFVAAVAGLLAEHSVIIVHGGGKEITDLHAQLGVATETVEGLRATSEESLRLVEMVLNGVGEHAAGALAGERRGGRAGAERGRHGPGARVSPRDQRPQPGPRGQSRRGQRRGAAATASTWA